MADSGGSNNQQSETRMLIIFCRSVLFAQTQVSLSRVVHERDSPLKLLKDKVRYLQFGFLRLRYPPA